MTSKSQSYTSGYRYYFAVLAGICRGPVDEIFLIKSNDTVMFDGSYRAPVYVTDQDYYDPDKPAGYDEIASAARNAGSIVDNETLIIAQPNLYGGDASEGGIDGLLSVYFGAKNQVIAAGDYIKTVMTQRAGLLLSDLRGVVTAFFDGEVCANNPYPKAWTYRVRRALMGWDGDVWYPERAVIKLTDTALPVYVRGTGDTSTSTISTVFYSATGTAMNQGASTGNATVTTVSSSYTGATLNTYSAEGGTQITYAVPQEYNDIRAMNPAHIIYECATNRDWGSGKDRNLIDNVSFTDAANTLYDEGFGLCMKWSRTEDVDTFVQTVLDHIGGVLYTDKLTGLLCLRLVRGNYETSSLPVFDYNSGLLEVTSTDTPANDVVANEVIVTYHSPVIDADKQARAQNIASMDSLGSIYSTTRDYSGLPTSTLAILVAQRDLKIFSGGWKKVEAKLDRRAYSLNPGDVIIINSPDRNLNNFVMRVATVQESETTDGSITITGAADIFGLPSVPMIQMQNSEFFEINRYPVPITAQNLVEATYRDQYLFNNYSTAGIDDLGTRVVLMAAKPTAPSLNFLMVSSSANALTGGGVFGPQTTVGRSNFSKLSTLVNDIGTTDNVIAVNGELVPSRVTIGAALCIMKVGSGVTNEQEIVRLDGISQDVTSGQVYLTVGRGCCDTPAVPHAAGSRVWDYDDTGGIIDPTEYSPYDSVQEYTYNRTTMGDATTANIAYISVGWRHIQPYSGADFRVNGYPRDATPDQTGDLVFTWKHRDRTLIEDKLVAESDAGGTREADVWYNVVIWATSAATGLPLLVDTLMTTNLGGGSLTGTTATITQQELTNAGVGNGAMKVFLQTYRSGSHAIAGGTLGAYESWRLPTAQFYYGTRPVTSDTGDGFNYVFDDEFDGVVA